MSTRYNFHRKITYPLSLLTICLFSAYAGGPDEYNNDNNDYETQFAEPTSLSSYYVGVNGGYVVASKFNSFVSPGYSTGAQVGYRDSNYRTSITLGYAQHQLFSDQVPAGAVYHLSTAMASLYYDFNYAGTIVPFFGAGAGYVYLWKTGCLDSNNNCARLIQTSRFAYQAIGGIGFQHKHIRFDIDYRYFSFLQNKGYSDNIIEGVFNYFFSVQ